MYAALLELSLPAITLNAASNYIRWTHVDTESDLQKIFGRMMVWNLGLATAIIVGGCVEVYRANKQAPLEWTDIAGRLTKISLHALAIGLAGAAVNHWCYSHLSDA